MKKLILLQAVMMMLISCSDDFLNDGLSNTELGDACEYSNEILPPAGFEVDTIGEIDFNGRVQSFQFIDHKVGYALGSNNVGGYVEVFKTTDGGETWTDLAIGIDQNPNSMVFRDENFGIITVHDVTGCPSACQNKTVLLKTENGGQDWQEIETTNLNGVLYHPQFDENGNLYANLFQIDQPSVLVKSINNGTTWDTLFAAPELGFESITFSFELIDDQLYIPTKDGDLVIINTEGELLKTLEIGNTSIWDVAVIDENNLVVALSDEVIKSIDGGDTWETIYTQSARIIGFESPAKGLALLNKSVCNTTDVYQVNDVFASTNNGGLNWTEAENTTTNLRINYADSQEMGENAWYTMINNYLIQIYEVQFK